MAFHWFKGKKKEDSTVSEKQVKENKNDKVEKECVTSYNDTELELSKIKLSGERYAKISNEENGEIRVQPEDEIDLSGCKCGIILVSETTNKKVVCVAEKKDDAYVANISCLKSYINGGRELFRCYFAACGKEQKMGFRLWTKLEQPYDDSYLSTIQPDVGRYGKMVLLKAENGTSYAAIPYRLEYSDKVSVLVDTEAVCKKICEGQLKVITEKKNYDYPYRFSVVMAIYNAEEYVREAIDSIINQTVGFEKNIQLILSDDGSTDSSPAICDEYAAKYPNNVVVLHKENGGVSTARNEGKKHATGKYVNFMDSDDIFETDVFAKVWDFFEKHINETDVVTIPLQMFGDMEGEYWQNYKFEKGTRVINLRNEYAISCMHVNASFIKNEIAKHYVFDERLPIAEDLKFMIQILIRKFTLGVVHNCKYMYRKRNDGNLSLVKASAGKKVAYNGYLNYVTKYLMDMCQEKFGYVPLYVQNTLMMDLQWKLRLPEIPEGVLTKEEEQEFVQTMIDLVSQFDDEVILAQRVIFWEMKFFLLTYKYKGKLQREPIFRDIIFLANGKEIRYVSQMQTAIELFSIEKEEVRIEGSHTLYGLDDDEIETYVCIGDRLLKCNNINRVEEKRTIVGKTARVVGFEISLPINEELLEKKVTFYLTVNGHAVLKRNVKYSKFTPFHNKYEHEYYVKDQNVIVHDRNSFTVKKLNSADEREKYEQRFVKDIKENIEEIKSKNADYENLPVYKDLLETVRLREEYFKKITKKEKEIWLLSDRITAAGDNGEALFAFLQREKPKGIETYFVISKETPDYKRIKKYGNVVEYKSHEHMLLTLLADKVISSHADEYVRYVFWKSDMCLQDLCNYKYVFLQHGIIQNDLSEWLQKYKKNIAMFVTSSLKEQQSILEGNYCYTEKEVKLTGLPRYDLLVQDKEVKKQIVVMPTWREYISTKVNIKTGLRKYNKKFKETDYYQFYQGLISDERLLEGMRKCGYTGKFVIHPALRENSIDFIGNDVFEVVTENISYQNEFVENALLVTDYSSVAFDFAYLKKPVIYSQFDKEYMYRNHICKEGYWDYDTMGFGPVCNDLRQTTDAILEAVENDCMLSEQYIERIEGFYYKFDQKNCERVYQAIQSLE